MSSGTDEREREDGDGFDDDVERAAKARRFLWNQASMTRSPLFGMLAALELQGRMFGISDCLDYSDDLSDVDECGPF